MGRRSSTPATGVEADRGPARRSLVGRAPGPGQVLTMVPARITGSSSLRNMTFVRSDPGTAERRGPELTRSAMSNRHRSHKETAPGATHPAPPKEERRAANRKARHRTHELLDHTDLELGEEIRSEEHTSELQS